MTKPKYKPIPVSAAKDLAKKYDKQQVIIVAWDPVFGKEHVTTYGTTLEACAQAAEGGNRIKRALNWPEELCKAKPARVKRAEPDPCGFDKMENGGTCSLRKGHRGSHNCPCGFPFNVCRRHAPKEGIR